jgi:hypothetical protein
MQLWWRIQRGDGEILSFTRFVLFLGMDFNICPVWLVILQAANWYLNGYKQCTPLSSTSFRSKFDSLIIL